MLAALQQMKSKMVTRTGLLLWRRGAMGYQLLKKRMLAMEGEYPKVKEGLGITVGLLFCVLFAGAVYKCLDQILKMALGAKYVLIDSGAMDLVCQFLIFAHVPRFENMDFGLMVNAMINITLYLHEYGLSGVIEIVRVSFNELHLSLFWLGAKEGLWDSGKIISHTFWSVALLVQVMPWMEGGAFPRKTFLTWVVVSVPFILAMILNASGVSHALHALVEICTVTCFTFFLV